jgi:hypothetical protein
MRPRVGGGDLVLSTVRFVRTFHCRDFIILVRKSHFALRCLSMRPDVVFW